MNNIIFEASVQDGKIEIPEAYREAMQQATIVQIKAKKKFAPASSWPVNCDLVQLKVALCV